MVALHRWNPDMNHAVLLFFYPFHFLMAMRDSRLHCYHFCKKIDHLLTSHCHLLHLPFFFLFLGLIPKRIISQLLVLMPAVLLILVAGLSPSGMRAFFGSFLLNNPWIIRVVHSINDVLRDLTADYSHMLALGIRRLLKTVSYLRNKQSSNWLFSDITCFQSFTIHWK